MNSPGTHRLVLVVEDEDSSREALVAALTEQGYLAVGLKTLRDARLVLRKIAPDAIVLDLGLPDGNGAELLEQLRTSTEPRLAAVPVLVVSASPDARARAASANAVLSKPVQTRSVVEALFVMLVRRNSQANSAA